jgi:hypothetical protein
LLKFITITSNLNQWFLGPVVGVGDEGEAVTVSPDPNPQIMREWSRLLLVQTMIILIPSSFVSMRRCDSDSRLEPCVHVLLKVAFGNVGVLSPFLYFHWLRFFFSFYTVLIATVQCVCGPVGFWSYSIFFKSYR